MKHLVPEQGIQEEGTLNTIGLHRKLCKIVTILSITYCNLKTRSCYLMETWQFQFGKGNTNTEVQALSGVTIHVQ